MFYMLFKITYITITAPVSMTVLEEKHTLKKHFMRSSV